MAKQFFLALSAFAALAATALPEEGDVVRVFDRDVYVHNPNFDADKIPPYSLEDPLRFVDGRRVTKETWPERRREILGLFAKEMIGQPPPAPEAVVTELISETESVAGFALRQLYRMWFRADRTGSCVNWIVWLPRHANGKAPVVLFLNYGGNHTLVPDADIPLMRSPLRCRPNERLSVLSDAENERQRGAWQDPSSDSILPLGVIVARGYAVMSACYCEVSPDPNKNEANPAFRQDPFAYTGVFELWGKRDPSRTDDVTSLGAWAWALSRGLDLAGRIRGIDATKSIVTGCSRLGKAAFIAAARDERFAVCAPVQTGGGGIPLAKRDFGENVSTECRGFTHWYCKAYAKYAKEPWKSLPFDQHLLVATIAPRALLVLGYAEPWFDAEGEFLSVKAASPVWDMLGLGGLPLGAMPKQYDTTAIGKHLGYAWRTHGHGISGYDWTWILDFADRVFEKGR